MARNGRKAAAGLNVGVALDLPAAGAVLAFGRVRRAIRPGVARRTADCRLRSLRRLGYRHPAFRGHKRRYVAQRAEELYPGRPHMERAHEALAGGWFVATHNGIEGMLTIIKGAAEVAGIRFGRGAVVELRGAPWRTRRFSRGSGA